MKKNLKRRLYKGGEAGDPTKKGTNATSRYAPIEKGTYVTDKVCPTARDTYKPLEVNKVDTGRSATKSVIRESELLCPGPEQPKIDFETWSGIFEEYMQVSDYTGDSEATKRNVLLLCLGAERVKVLVARPGERRHREPPEILSGQC